MLGSIPAALFAVVLLNASLIGAGALTLDQLRVRGRLPWLNVLAIVIVAVLVLLSLILMATTAFPNIDVTAVALGGGAVLAVGLSVAALLSLRSRRRGGRVTETEPGPTVPKEQWTMPPLAFLARPVWSTSRKIAMLTLRGYLVVSVALLIVKAVQLSGG